MEVKDAQGRLLCLVGLGEGSPSSGLACLLGDGIPAASPGVWLGRGPLLAKLTWQGPCGCQAGL